MTFESYPNNAHNSRAISLAEHEQIIAPMGGTGLIGYSTTTPVYSTGTGTRTVKLRAGVRATIRGTRFNNLTETDIDGTQILANTSGSARVDLLVLRLNREAADPNKFTITPVVITGVPGPVPVAPLPVRNDTIDATGVWDLPLAEIAVPNGATSIAVLGVTNRAWWITPSGFTGLDAAKPPAEPGIIFRANDSGISYVATNTGTWQRIYSNTGWVNVSPPSGWTSNPFGFARVNDLVIMVARIVRTGAAVASTVSTTMHTLASQFRPSQTMYGVYHCTSPDHSAHVGINIDGTIIFAGTGSDPIAQNATLLSNMVWLAAS